MTKQNRKLSLHRDTVLRLEPIDDLKQVQGGIVSSDNRLCWTRPVRTV